MPRLVTTSPDTDRTPIGGVRPYHVSSIAQAVTRITLLSSELHVWESYGDNVSPYFVQSAQTAGMSPAAIANDIAYCCQELTRLLDEKYALRGR